MPEIVAALERDEMDKYHCKPDDAPRKPPPSPPSGPREKAIGFGGAASTSDKKPPGKGGKQKGKSAEMLIPGRTPGGGGGSGPGRGSKDRIPKSQNNIVSFSTPRKTSATKFSSGNDGARTNTGFLSVAQNSLNRAKDAAAGLVVGGVGLLGLGRALNVGQESAVSVYGN